MSASRGLSLFVAASLLGVSLAAIPKDKVTTLPGWKGKIPFDFYSGHIKVPANGVHYMYHYEFHGSQSDPMKDPLTMWEQGGPGVSSILWGALTEMGPFHVNLNSEVGEKNGIPNLLWNTHAWNRESNVLYFDHPPGVRFSYCIDEAGKPLAACPTWDDTMAAKALANAIATWVDNFSEYRNHDLYFSGESYAGIYVPSTAWEWINNLKITAPKLKGLFVGNGCANVHGATEANKGNCNGPTRDEIALDMLYRNSLIDWPTYDSTWNTCGFPETNWRNLSTACQTALNDANKLVGPINWLYINDNCPSGTTPPPLGSTVDDFIAPQARPTSTGHGRMEAEALKEKMRISTPIPHGGTPYGCGTYSVPIKWLTNPAVMEALHLTGTYELSSFNYIPFGFSSVDHWARLVDMVGNVVIYNGVSDTVCPWPQNEQWVNGLKLPMEISWRQWGINNGNPSYGKDNSGYFKTFKTAKGSRLVFATVNDAGHMVPTYQPARAYELYTRFLRQDFNMSRV